MPPGCEERTIRTKKNLPEAPLFSIIQGEQLTSDLNRIYFLWKNKMKVNPIEGLRG